MSDSNFAIRLKLFMDALGLSSSQLADRCGIPRPSLSAILAGRNKKISDTLIGQIHSEFPQLSVLWLMFGEGDMFLSPVSSQSVSATPFNSEDSPMEDAYLNASGESAPSSASASDFSPFDFHDGLGDQFIPRASSLGFPSGDKNSSSENLNFPSNGTADSSQSNLRGLKKGENEAQDRMNKGFEGDLRTVALMRQIENMRANPRKVTQITIYYDDSTFETFYPSRS